MSRNKSNSIKIKGVGTKRSTSFLGMVCGVLAAVAYGPNPLGALKLYATVSAWHG